MNAKDMMIAGRVQLIFGSVFFGNLATHMRLVEAPNLDPPTMAVDGVSLFYHPDFVKKLSKPEIQGVIAHEVLHLVFLTHLRRGSRNPKLWNVATDYAINLVLKDEKFTLPDGVLLDEKFRDWSAEKIYNYLQENPDEQPQDGDGGWNVGGVMDGGTGGDDGKEGSAPAMSQSEMEVAIGEMKAKVQAAAITAKKAGQFSAGMDRLIDKVCAPRANWRVILQRFLTEQAFSDWDYSRCHTRMLHQYNVVNPVLGGEKMGSLALIIDTSGSIDDDQLAQFGGEISDILDQYPCTIHVIYCDTAVNQEPDTYTQDDLPLRLKAVGGGGTRMKPAFDWVLEEADDVAAVILYSDSYLFDWGEISFPSCPTLMACSEKRIDSGVPDFIEVIDITE